MNLNLQIERLLAFFFSPNIFTFKPTLNDTEAVSDYNFKILTIEISVWVCSEIMFKWEIYTT